MLSCGQRSTTWRGWDARKRRLKSYLVLVPKREVCGRVPRLKKRGRQSTVTGVATGACRSLREMFKSCKERIYRDLGIGKVS